MQAGQALLTWHLTFWPPGRLPSVSLQPFEQIVADYGPMVLRVCRAVLGPDDAEDAWSETFLAALRAYPDLRADANVEAWLVTIAHRKAIDATRAAARRPIAIDELPERPPAPDGPSDWDGDLWAALAGAAGQAARAVAYHYLAGLPYARDRRHHRRQHRRRPPGRRRRHRRRCARTYLARTREESR